MKACSPFSIPLRLALVFMFLSVAFTSFGEPLPPRSPESAVERYLQAVSQFDIEMYISSYWEDAVRTEVHPNGQRVFLEGLDVLVGHQVALVEEALNRGEFVREAPPREPDYVGEVFPGTIEFSFAEDGGHSYEGFLVTERHGEWRISRQILFERYMEIPALGDVRSWVDENRNGFLEIDEQRSLFDAMHNLLSDQAWQEGPFAAIADFNRDGDISPTERMLTRETVFINQIMRMYRFSPDFAREYIDFDGSGDISLEEARHAMWLVFDEGAGEPRPVTEPMEHRLDLDENGFLSRTELNGFIDLLMRKIAVLPDWYIVTAETPDNTEEVMRWLDANGDGFSSDVEWNTAASSLRSAMTAENVLAADPLILRFDADRSGVLNLRERNDVREYVFESMLSGNSSGQEGALVLLDLNNNSVIDREEFEQFTELLASTQDRYDAKPRNVLEERMDQDPNNGRIDEGEIEPFINEILTVAVQRWLVPEQSAPGALRIADERDPGSYEIDNAAPQVVSVNSPKVAVTASFDGLFPVLFKYYDSASFGAVTVTNQGSDAIRDVVAQLEYEKYIDNPKSCGPIALIEPGSTGEINVTTLFNNAVLSITEGTKVAAKLIVTFTSGGVETREESTVRLNFYDRNALRWDDSEKTASFVTAKDPQIKLFVGNMIAAAREHERSLINQPLQRAMLIFAALNKHGMTYLVDMRSSYSALSQSDNNVDYLQFPIQTLQYKTGDCDDLSICYNALLEAAGVQTAFITVPGHIFSAIHLDIDSSEISQTFNKADDLIVAQDGTVWLPVEVTALGKSFLDAWQIGAKQWKESSAKSESALYPTDTAWASYQPVQFNPLAGTAAALVLPDSSAVASDFLTELDRFVKREITRRELAYMDKLKEDPSNAKIRNRLGVLYARYGLSDKAESAFKKILESEEYAPALLNLGNLKFLNGDAAGALTHYKRAEAAHPTNARAILGIAKVYHDLAEYQQVSTYYDKLISLSAPLASRYAYLDMKSTSSARASSIVKLKGAVEWDTEEDDE